MASRKKPKPSKDTPNATMSDVKPPSLLQLVRAARRVADAQLRNTPRDEINRVCVKLRTCDELLTALEVDQVDATAVQAAMAQAEAVTATEETDPDAPPKS